MRWAIRRLTGIDADTGSFNRPVGTRLAFGTRASLLRLLKEAALGWMRDNAMRLSAAVSFYSILSLAPLLVIALKIVGLVWTHQGLAREQITRQMTSLMGSQAAEALKPMIERGGKQGHGVLATAVSSAILLFSATGVFIELQDALNTIWGVTPRQGRRIHDFLWNRLLTLAMVFGIGLLLLLSTLFSTVLTAAATYVAGNKNWFAFVVDAIASFGVAVILFGAVFKLLPEVKLAWKHVWLGAVATAVGFTIGKYALVVYLKYAAPLSAFGAAGSLAAVLLWVYYSSFILLFGAELTKVWALHNSHRA
jgi:membrane protein